MCFTDQVDNSIATPEPEDFASFRASRNAPENLSTATSDSALAEDNSELVEKKKSDPQQAQPQEESSSTATSEHEEEKAQEKKSVLDYRFSKISKEAQEAKAQAAKLASEKAQYEEQLKQYQAAQKLPEPDYADYDDPIAYGQAMAQYAAKEAKLATEREIREAQQREMSEKQVAKLQAQVEDFKKDHPDFDDLIVSQQKQILDNTKYALISEAIRESDVGAALLYEMAKDDSLVDQINEATLANALKLLGRVEAGIVANSNQGLKPQTRNNVSKAPAPITPLRPTSSASATNTDPDEGLSFADFKARRMAGARR